MIGADRSPIAVTAHAGQNMKLVADLNHMHLIDGESGRVL
jgi:hypothetical protein